MRWYKILAQILLLLFVIDFALAAPVVLQEREIRISVVDITKGGTATSPLRWDPLNKWLASADRTNAPPTPRSSDQGHWRGWEARQHNPTDSNGPPEPLNRAPLIDLNTLYSSPSPPGSTSPLPTSQAPTGEPTPLNPSSPHGNTEDSGSSHTSDEFDLNFAPQSSSQRFKSLSELMSIPIHDIPPPDGSPQTAPPPDEPVQIAPPPDEPPRIASSPGEPPQIASSPGEPPRIASSPDESPRIASSPDESRSSSSWVPTDSGSTSSSSSPPANSPGLLQGHVPSQPIPGDDLPSDGHSSSSSPASSGNLWEPTDSDPTNSLGSSQDHVPSTPNPGDDLPSDSHSSSSDSTSEKYHPSSPDPSQHSTDESNSLIQGSTDNHPLRTSPLSLGPSTEPNPPPSAKRPRPEELEFESFLSKIFKGKVKRRFSGSGALKVAEGLSWSHL